MFGATDVGLAALHSNAMSDTTDHHDRLDAIDLPTDVADAVADVFGASDRPATFGDVVRDVEGTLAPEGAIEAEDFFRNGPTRHAVHLDGGVEHVPCVIDALVLAALVEQREVRIASGSPVDGTVVGYRVTGDDVAVTPADAVVSLGVAPADVEEPPDGAGLSEDPELSSCAYINSFPDEAAYEEWAAATDAVAVTALSVDEAVAVARAAADGPLFAGSD